MSERVKELGTKEWLLKLAALLHDPPDKVALTPGHGKRAAGYLPNYFAEWAKERGVDIKELIRKHHADEHEVPEEVRSQLKRLKLADWFSSASERIALDLASEVLGLSRMDVGYIELVHPFSGLKSCLGKLNAEELRKQLRTGKLPLVSNVLDVLRQTTCRPWQGILRGLGDSGAKLLYLLFWRLLESKWRELVKGRTDPRAASLPADSRVPTHSIWDHVEATSALIPCIEAKGSELVLRASLLSMDLGGVQLFISAARKTSDLWAGSWISSVLSWSAIKEGLSILGPDAVIYPYIKGFPFVDLWIASELAQLLMDRRILSERDAEEFSRKLIEELWKLDWGSIERGKRLLYLPLVPNSALILAPNHLCKTLEKCMREGLENCWKQICESARERIRNLLIERIPKSSIEEGWEERWSRQVERPPLWPMRIVYTPFPEKGEDVEEFLTENCRDLPKELVNPLLRLVKRLRKVKPTIVYGAVYALNSVKLSAYIPSFNISVEPSPREEGGEITERCSLCGIRNPLFLKKEVWRALKDARPGLIEWDERLDSGEYLCAPCLIKRLLGSDSVFFKEIIRAVIGLPEGLSEGLAEERLEVRFPSTSDFATATFKASLCEAIFWAIERREEEGALRKLLNEAKRLNEELSRLRQRIGITSSRQPPAIEARLSWLRQIRAKIEGSTDIQGKASEISEGLMSIEELLRIPGEFLMEETWLRLRERFEGIHDKLEEAHKKLREFLKYAESLIEEWFSALEEDGELPLYIGECVNDLNEVPGPLMPYAWRKNPGSFFALLKSDGDDMGRWISGEFLPSYFDSLHPQIREQIRSKGEAKGLLQDRRAMSPASHMAFSRALMSFAARIVPRVVEEIGFGSVVYSGGDDLIALLAPELALEVAQRLAEEFSREFYAVPGLIIQGLGYRVSCSTGLIITHYMYHLGRAVEIAVEAMEKAKDVKGKGAIYAELLGRAGPIVKLECGVHWTYPWDKKKLAEQVKLHQYGMARWWKGLSLSRNPSDPLTTILVGAGELRSQSSLRSPIIEAQAIASIVNGLAQLEKKNIRVARRLIHILNAPELRSALAAGGPIIPALIRREVDRHVEGPPQSSAFEQVVKSVLHRSFTSWYQTLGLGEVINDFMGLVHIANRCLSESLLRAKPRGDEIG